MPMIVNTRWLQEYLQPHCSHAELLDALPRIGLELEIEHELKTALEPIRIGFIREKKPLPGAADMFLCQVEIERGKVVPIVCANEHEIREGWGVPVAPVGTTLPTGKAIQEREVRGQRSLGMICLDGELGMTARDTGMHHFTDEATLGEPLPKLTDIPEYLLELNVLPNRPDFLGLIGIAREVAALLRIELRTPPVFTPAGSNGAAAPFTVEIQDPKLCTRYMGSVVRGVKVAPSPAWLKSRLLLTGARPRNNIVDITNYVLYEYGQPLHAFDLAKIQGGKIIVRRMAPGESLTLLVDNATLSADDKKFANPPLVIADASRPIALAGIMGGAETQTTDSTTGLLIESAHFDPATIRKTARAARLNTDSSYRFERGTDPNTMLEGALGRALQLITELAGGKVEGPIVDQYSTKREPRVLHLSSAKTSSYLGMHVSDDVIRDSLGRLHMQFEPTSCDAMAIRVPTWRTDATDPVVLIEDVARMVGYDKIPVAPTPAAPSLGARSSTDRMRQTVSNFLVSAGFYESRNPSLEPPDMAGWMWAPQPRVSLTNPQSKEMSVLRRTLLPGLLKTVDNNLRRGVDAIRFFEIDRAFAETEEKSPLDPWVIGAIAGGRARQSDWRGGGQPIDFHELKGIIEDLFGTIGVKTLYFDATEGKPFVAGTAAIISIAREAIGVIGELDASQINLGRLPYRLFSFEIDLHALEKAAATLPAYRALSRQPAVTRDLAFIVKSETAFDELFAAMKKAAGESLESLRFGDLYQGPPVPAGHKSLAFHFIFRDPTRTLTADEISATMDRIIDSLKTKFAAEIREK
jgi:phenylalanyl-tRNA synthetase beta chain